LIFLVLGQNLKITVFSNWVNYISPL
jgi:hypothetical protein